jgi:ubiquitin-like modifier-activating enzyme 5
MLVRCGIGKLVFIDFDTVEMANMNRLFYRPEHVGLTKTVAARQILHAIDPAVELEDHCLDVTKVATYDLIKEILQTHGHPAGQPVDLLLGCVDNYGARLCLDRVALEIGMPWMECGVSENGVSGHVQFIQPGLTACFHCAPPLVVASGIDEATLKRDGVCAASLPTTMAIIAGLLVQNALKFLLRFGQVGGFLGYGALIDHFPTYTMRPNPDCSNPFCRLQQQRVLSAPPATPAPAPQQEEVAPPAPANEWGISLLDSEAELSVPAPSSPSAVSTSLPTSAPPPSVAAVSLDDLRQGLDSLFELVGVCAIESIEKATSGLVGVEE